MYYTKRKIHEEGSVLLVVMIKDIAKVAGVTNVTVSRALNNEPGVSEQMRQKIKAIAEQMNYVPSSAAKKVVPRQPKSLGLIWPQKKGVFFLDLGLEFQKEASRRGLQVILSMASPEEALRCFNQYGIDYVIFWRGGYWNPSLGFLQEKERFRGDMLLLGGWKAEHAHSITIDKAGGFRQAVYHLQQLGHRRIVFVGQPEIDKYNGFMQGMAELKLDYKADQVVDPKDPDFTRKLTELMQGGDKPTAMIADSHGTLHNTTGLLRKLNIRIPDDLSLIVYDDTELQFFDIPLTTIGPSIRELTEKALDILTRDVRPGEEHVWEEIEIKSHLNVRSSTIPVTGV